MPKKIYLDSNVFISFVREEIDSAFNIRYVESTTFFDFCSRKKHILLLSILFFKEVQKIIFLSKKDVLEEFNRIKVICFLIERKPNTELINKIIKEGNLHYSDSVHVANACENKADFIVTWNKKDFEKAKKFIECFSPKEIQYIL